MKSLAEQIDIFNNVRLFKPDNKVISERSELIGFFADNLQKEPKIIGIRLAHYTLDQLYALKSNYSDRVRRQSKDTADKYFWFISRKV